MRHVRELWKIEWFRPIEATLGEHLDRRSDPLCIVERDDLNEHHARGARVNRHVTPWRTFELEHTISSVNKTAVELEHLREHPNVAKLSQVLVGP